MRTRMNRNSLKWHLIEGLVTYDFTLHLRVRDHTTWFGRCVATAFGHSLLGSHNSMVTPLGSCVKWPLVQYQMMLFWATWIVCRAMEPTRPASQMNESRNPIRNESSKYRKHEGMTWEIGVCFQHAFLSPRGLEGGLGLHAWACSLLRHLQWNRIW